MGFFRVLIQFFFWLQAFAAPVLVSGLIAFEIGKEKFFIPLLIVGGIAGIILAEYIRRKIGLSTFFGRIYGANDWDERWKKKD